ncbi:hydrogenase nickel incorporation protein HypB [Rhodococcus jostii]|uniref:hydrogenase nickel incorporation protein HypB n=1 Tax=Rhodococcus jostii TaxID=132919 RepID=UPI00362B3F7D
MCATCGCGDETGTRITVPHDHDHEHSHDHEHPHDHDHDHEHSHDHSHDHEHPHTHEHPHEPATETVTLEQKVLAKNDLTAERNRGWLAGRGVLALNVMSSPGSGKTTLLERTIADIGGQRRVSVVEGDQETMLDANRIKATGCAVVQVNTGAGCHLDAEMMRDALTALDPEPNSLLFIENVGNLVCPALFDLGEKSRVVVISVTEGTDKPLKYPHMFAAANLVIVNKADLLPYVDFDVDLCTKYARSVNPELQMITLSATTGHGIAQWYDWIAKQ